MDIRHVGDAECISCGECISTCPTGAITWKGSKFVLPPDEIAGKPASPDPTKKYAKRRKVLSITAAVLMSAALIGALVYCNFIYQAPEIPDGNKVGNVCIDQTVSLIDETGIIEQTFTVSQNAGKVTVINFWGTWCASCIEELPYFDALASEYADKASVLALHTLYESEAADEYIAENYPDTLMLFGLDANEYYTALGGTGMYPMTVVVNGDGIITARFDGSVTHEELIAAVEDALTN
jgi:thiol-disulfide isomerase/thioredoxin